MKSKKKKNNLVKYCFFFYKFLIFNLIPNGCKNCTFLKRHTPTFFIFSAKIALFFVHIFKNLTQKNFGGDDKNSWILRKQHFFCIWIFYFRKNKMKVGFGYEKSSFLRDKYWNCGPKMFAGDDKNSWNSAKTALFPLFGLCVIHMPHLCFLKEIHRWEKIRWNFYENQTQKTKFLEEIAAKIAQKSNTKNKMFGEKWGENRTFWKKNIF